MKLIIVIASIVMCLIAVGCTNSDKNFSNKDISKKSSTIIEAKMNVEDWKTYSNVQYGYNIHYPSDYEITQFEGFGNTKSVTPDGNYIKVFDNNQTNIFSIRGNAIEQFSEEAIKKYFSNRDSVLITEVKIDEQIGYKAVSKTTTNNYDYYFIQKPDNSVLEISVLKNSDIGVSILSTLSFH